MIAKRLFLNHSPSEWFSSYKKRLVGDHQPFSVLGSAEHRFVLVASRTDKLDPLGQVDSMIPDAFQVLDDHQQIQCGIHIGRAGCDLLRQHLLDLVKVCVHCVIRCNDLLRGGLVLSGQRCQSVQDLSLIHI